MSEAFKDGQDEDVRNEDFQAVLKQLLAAYQAQLEQNLRWAQAPEELLKIEESRPPSCEEEIELGTALFEKFFTEDVAWRLLPAAGREAMGPMERWRWCWLHLRCCMLFGWLVCRGPRTFRGWAYYVYRYWLCVRRMLGRPVEKPGAPVALTAEEAADLKVVIQGFAQAFRPYLEDQIASADLNLGLPDDLVSGKLDCNEGDEETAAMVARFLGNQEVLEALVGKAVFVEYRQNPVFWYCRCWCLCSIAFGCCLARARNLIGVVRCLKWYRACLRRCFQPLTCDLSEPQGCVDETFNQAVNAMTVSVMGSAGGLGFSHYVLEWSRNGVAWHADSFLYPPIPPGGAVQGNAPVFGGLLALFDTTLRDPGLYFLRLTVFSVTGATCVRQITFELFKRDVRITGVDGVFTLDTSPFDPNARFVENVPALCTRPASVSEVSFGTCLTVWGGASVGGCENKRIKRYLLDYQAGFQPNPLAGIWTNFWSVEYNTPAQYRSMNLRQDDDVLTAVWGPDCLVPFFPCPPPAYDPQAKLVPSCWSTKIPGTCNMSGLYTIRLTVEDTDGTLYYDVQRIWLDNKPICARILIDAVPKCADLFVSNFALPPDCSVAWNLPLKGVAYDELIDTGGAMVRPNDNFDYYVISVRKQGGPQIQIPISLPPVGGPCYYGVTRKGSCTPCGPGPNVYVDDVLALFDLRAVDKDCKGNLPYAVPDAFTVPRGECCVYTFYLTVYDRTYRPSGVSYATDDWSVKICNDLK